MHRPTHLRDALLAWLSDAGEAVEVAGQARPWQPERLVAELWGSTDTLPPEVCERFGLPRGCTYGHAVRLLMWAHERHPGGSLADAIEVLERTDDGELRPHLDVISDLLREEDRLRSQPPQPSAGTESVPAGP